MTTPGWLRNLIDSGTPVKTAFKQYVRLTICDHCMTRVFTAVADYPWGRDTVMECEPLNPAGEAWALAAGLKTYRLYGSTIVTCEVDMRGTWDIIMTPCSHVLPSGTVIRVLVQHVCGLSLPYVYREDV